MTAFAAFPTRASCERSDPDVVISAPAIVCTAPGRFSTMTFQPSLSDRSLATTRLMMTARAMAFGPGAFASGSVRGSNPSYAGAKIDTLEACKI